MIRRAKIEEIPEILELTNACARHMTDAGIYQWNEHYPSREAFIKDISRKELYISEVEGRTIGVIAITTQIDEEYVPVQWLTQTSNNLYVHRLAVHPEFQGRGYAQKLMSFAEKQAREKQYISVRLDTFSKNYQNQNFYEKRGYKKLGDIYFPKQSEYPFHCYELIL
ncbi:MAG: GNAT family N-acetyltransferase [Flavobacteriaceae bacterium]